ncbi:MAG: DUF1036 domain-containing protein [bacterium]|nr:DUF1036 domain-containing protein [bacterium]
MADFKICNPLENKVQAAVAYQDERGWLSKGWMTIGPHTCAMLVEGALKSRYIYFHALERKKGFIIGEWSGKTSLCTGGIGTDFAIRGIKACKSGHRKRGFVEIDTGEQTDWVVKLGDSPVSKRFVATSTHSCRARGISEAIECSVKETVTSCDVALKALKSFRCCDNAATRFFCEDRGHGRKCRNLESVGAKLSECVSLEQLPD